MTHFIQRVCIVITLLAIGVGILSAQDEVTFPIMDDAFDVLTEVNSIAYYSPTARADVATFYKTEMTLAGWTLTTELEGRGRVGTILVFVNSADDEVTVVIGEGPARDGQVRTVSSIVIDHPFTNVNLGMTPISEGGTQPSESTETVSESTPLTQTLNLEFIFDASGSMSELIESEQKIIAARRTIDSLVQSLPTDDVNLNVGFRVFGHEGDNTESGRAISCASTELIVPIDGVDIDALIDSAGAYVPTGWTPISLALTDALDDFSMGESVRNVIILLSDGEETCDGDPIATAEMLANSDAAITIHVVGLGVTDNTANQLSSIASSSNGAYLNVADGQSLTGAILGLVSGEFQLSGGTLAIPDRVIDFFAAGSGEFTGIVIKDGVIQIDSFQAGSANFSGVEIDMTTGGITIETGEAGSATFEDLDIEIPDFSIGD